MGGGKRTEERALPKNSGPLQKSFWSAQSWLFVQEKESNDTRGGWKTYRTRGGPKPLFGRGVLREVFLPPLFSTPPWRPLKWPGELISDVKAAKRTPQECKLRAALLQLSCEMLWGLM